MTTHNSKIIGYVSFMHRLIIAASCYNIYDGKEVINLLPYIHLQVPLLLLLKSFEFLLQIKARALRRLQNYLLPLLIIINLVLITAHVTTINRRLGQKIVIKMTNLTIFQQIQRNRTFIPSYRQ